MDILNSYIDKFENLDKQKFPRIREFLNNSLPVFSCSDKTVEEIYYFRAYTFVKHIKKNRAGKYIITEWSDSEAWKETDGAISCAVGHHLSELKWFKSADYIAKDYIGFWCDNIDYLLYYNNWFIYAVYDYCLATDNMDFAYSLSDKLEEYFIRFESAQKSKLGIYKCVDNYDGMELSISAFGLRPTVNSYIYGNAVALSEIFKYGKEYDKAEKYESFAKDLKGKINKQLFSDDFYYNQPIAMWEEMPRLLPRFSNPRQEYGVKELIGYVPFYFGIDEKEHTVAWKYFADKKVFSAPYGLTTADMSHEQFNFSYPHMCLWNGPVWPYATSQTLVALYKTLRRYGEENLPVKNSDYVDAVKVYAKSQYITEDGIRRPWIDEDLDGQTGEWIAKKWLCSHYGMPNERGKDYNHSSYIDLILGGLCGIEKRGKEIKRQPLTDGSITFSVEKI